jgi:ABC-2 type transport system ATP-binding protein
MNTSAASIQVTDLAMTFRGCEALKGVSLTVPTGSVFALLGENGAGKTTLIRILMGFQRPSRGTAHVLGLDSIHNTLEIRRRVGYVSDMPQLYDWMKVDEIGWFAACMYPEGYVDRYRESLARFELPAARKIKHLSKGQRAKVALSLALAHDPDLLILDEPTSGLDPLVRREFMESMVERAATGKTVFLSSHQISEVERVADTVAILHAGKVCISESLAELKETIFEVTIVRDDPLVALPSFALEKDVLNEFSDGRQLRWIVRGFNEEHQEQIESWPSVLQVRSRPATLDEIFVACTRGKSGLATSANIPTRSTDLDLLQPKESA